MEIQSQDLKQHRWKNRLIILLSQNTTHDDLKEQLAEFKNHMSGLQERKLLIYQITPGKFKQVLNKDSKWSNTTKTFFSANKSDDSSFELLLIGLDGGTKLRKKSFTSSEEIFRLIDSMPMRRQELEEKTYGRQ